MRNIKSLLLAVIMALASMLMPSVANAQFYGGVGGGLAIPKNVVLNMKTTTLTARADDGWSAYATVGYDTGPVRFELEASQSRMTVSQLSNSRTNFSLDKGFRRLERTAMVNVMGDIPLSSKVTFTIGGGIGAARISMRAKRGLDCQESIAIRAVNDAPNRREGPNNTCQDQGDGGQTALGYQGIGGFNYKFNDRLSLDVTGRFVRIDNVRTAGKNVQSREVRFTDGVDYDSARVQVGGRFTF